MKKSLLLFVCMYLSLACAGQTFQKVYGDTISETGRYFFPADESGFHLLTRGQNYSSPDKFSALQTDQYGDSLNSVIIPNTCYQYESYCLNCDNEFVLVEWKETIIGNNKYKDTLYVTTADAFGNILSTWSYPDTFSFYGSRIIKTRDGGYLLALGNWNSQFNANILFMKLDSQGNLQWRKEALPYTLSGEVPLDLMESSDNCFIALIYQGSGQNSAGSKVMMKLDSAGNILWTSIVTYGYPAGRMQQLVESADGYLYMDNIGTLPGSLHHYSRIGLVDTSGSLQWAKTCQNDHVSYYGINYKNSGGFYLCGTISNDTNAYRQIIFTELDMNADSVKSFTLGFDSASVRPEYFKQLIDDRLGVIGTHSPYFNTSYRYNDIYFAICDTMGNIVTGTENISFNNELIIYPNPATGRFNVSALQFTIRTLEIYNTLGEKVYFIKANSDSITLNISLKKGIYFVRVSDGEKILVKKLVVE
jgi:hypothetical protein